MSRLADGAMSVSPAVNAGIRDRVLHRLRALMARSVANGATEQEELVAARMVGKLVGQVDQLDGTQIAPREPELKPPNWAQAERDSREYQQVLEKTTIEGLFRTAVQELALEHINRVAPPRRRQPGEQIERVGIHDLLEPYLGMVLAANGSRLAREFLVHAIDELVYDGALPSFLDIPVGK